MINLLKLPETIEKPNMCFMESNFLISAAPGYDTSFDMRAGRNSRDLAEEIFLSK